MTRTPTDPERLRRRASLLWGVALIALLFLLETWQADRVMPNPASPYVWAFLALVGLLAAAGAVHAGRAAKRSALPTTSREAE